MVGSGQVWLRRPARRFGRHSMQASTSLWMSSTAAGRLEESSGTPSTRAGTPSSGAVFLHCLWAAEYKKRTGPRSYACIDSRFCSGSLGRRKKAGSPCTATRPGVLGHSSAGAPGERGAKALLSLPPSCHACCISLGPATSLMWPRRLHPVAPLRLRPGLHSLSCRHEQSGSCPRFPRRDRHQLSGVLPRAWRLACRRVVGDRGRRPLGMPVFR